MSKFLPLTFLVILLLGFSNETSFGDNGCGRIKVDYSVDKISGGASKLTVRPNGGAAPYHYVLLNEDKNLVSNRFDKNVFENLKPGVYRCIVSDSQDCTADFEIKVQ